MDNPVVWGFDIGGTKCALCAADKAGHILCRHEIATADFQGWQEIMQTLVDWGRADAMPFSVMPISPALYSISAMSLFLAHTA